MGCDFDAVDFRVVLCQRNRLRAGLGVEQTGIVAGPFPGCNRSDQPEWLRRPPEIQFYRVQNLNLFGASQSCAGCGSGLRVQGVCVGAQGLGFRVQGRGLGVYCQQNGHGFEGLRAIGHKTIQRERRGEGEREGARELGGTWADESTH